MTAILRNYDGLATVSRQHRELRHRGRRAGGGRGSPGVHGRQHCGGARAQDLQQLRPALDATGSTWCARHADSPWRRSAAQSSISLTWGAQRRGRSRGLLRLPRQLVRRSVHPDHAGAHRPHVVLRGRWASSPLTRYYYKVTAVDSSGNESRQSPVADASTNPPNHTIFPIEMGRATPAPVAIDYVYQHSMMDIFAGADFVWAWHADGTVPLTPTARRSLRRLHRPRFLLRGRRFAGDAERHAVERGRALVGLAQAVLRVRPRRATCARAGRSRPWTRYGRASPWATSTTTVRASLVFASNGNRFYAYARQRHEWMDGDADPVTQGVFKVLGSFLQLPAHRRSPTSTPTASSTSSYASTDGRCTPGAPTARISPASRSRSESAAPPRLRSATWMDPPTRSSTSWCRPNNDSLYVFKSGRRPARRLPVIGMRIGGTSKNPRR